MTCYLKNIYINKLCNTNCLIFKNIESINKSEHGKYRSYDFSSNALTTKKIYTKKSNGVSYECISKSGTGSFGVVFKAKIRHSGKLVAIKRVLQDMRYKVGYLLIE